MIEGFSGGSMLLYYELSTVVPTGTLAFLVLHEPLYVCVYIC